SSILRQRGITVSSVEATLMMLGIYEDTGSLTFPSTTVEDFQAAAWLLEQGAHLNTVADFITQELTAEQVSLPCSWWLAWGIGSVWWPAAVCPKCRWATSYVSSEGVGTPPQRRQPLRI